MAETEFPEHDLMSALNVFYVSSVGRLEARRLSATERANSCLFKPTDAADDSHRRREALLLIT